MKRSAHTYAMALSTVRLSAAIMVSYSACVNTDVETHEMTWNCELLYSIYKEMPCQPITFSFTMRIRSEYSDQMFISDEQFSKWL